MDPRDRDPRDAQNTQAARVRRLMGDHERLHKLIPGSQQMHDAEVELNKLEHLLSAVGISNPSLASALLRQCEEVCLTAAANFGKASRIIAESPEGIEEILKREIQG